MKNLGENHEQHELLQEGDPANHELTQPSLSAAKQVDQIQQTIASAKVDLPEIGLAALPANDFQDLNVTNPALDAARDIQMSTAAQTIADQSMKSATAHPIFSALGELALSTQISNYSFTNPNQPDSEPNKHWYNKDCPSVQQRNGSDHGQFCSEYCG